ncbi:hypothetical protein [Mycolicibacterium mengxianglii]|uniref:hypothetical protein n=1 Tax=Mycolicibacterium mengxianglii TaxID=2736649 RepID=UPI0018D0B590|nr:hypothetical protein [Mycolicibacterium mengxianglii]
MTDGKPTLINRLLSQEVRGDELDQVNDLIANGTDVYLAQFEFEHAHHALLVAHVSPWAEEATDVTVTFAEKALPNKRIAMDEQVTVHYLQPFNLE